MKRALLVPAFALAALLGGVTVPGSTVEADDDDSVLRAGCMIEVILDRQRVCLDGVWVLSSGILGDGHKYRFLRDRGCLLLVPVLTDEETVRLRARIPAASLDTQTVAQALSIQGVLQPAGIFFEQHNSLVRNQETARYTLAWKRDQFSGYREIVGAGGVAARPQPVTLTRFGKQAAIDERDDDEDLHF